MDNTAVFYTVNVGSIPASRTKFNASETWKSERFYKPFSARLAFLRGFDPLRWYQIKINNSMITFTIPSSRLWGAQFKLIKPDTFKISYSNVENFNRISGYQRAVIGTVFLTAQKYCRETWELIQIAGYYDRLPNDPVILDIGSGIGLVDMLAYQYLPETAKFYLVDKNEVTANLASYPQYSEDYFFYHDWTVTEDIIHSSNFNRDAFIFLDTQDNWPEQIDLITSYGSWCWHYPLSKYWDKVKSHLKIGGKLVIDVSDEAEADASVIETISNEFGSTATLVDMGGGCIRYTWTRLK